MQTDLDIKNKIKIDFGHTKIERIKILTSKFAPQIKIMPRSEKLVSFTVNRCILTIATSILR